MERALPWIRKVHFVTWGHLPPWLNTEHPKLHIVRHDEFIPRAYLPTFSSSAIMLNIHRIPGLAEQFILSNDDFFYLDETAPEEYFQNGLPCDQLHIKPITEVCTDNFGYILWNNISCLNEHFDLRSTKTNGSPTATRTRCWRTTVWPRPCAISRASIARTFRSPI